MDRFTQHFVDYIGEREIAPELIKGYRIHLAKKLNAPSSIKRYIVAAKPYLDELRALGKHSVPRESVDTLLKAPRAIKGKRPEALKPEQLRALLVTAASWPDKELAKFVLLASTTGARVSEACSIKGEDFDASEGTLRVFSTKTNAYRYIPLKWSSTLTELAKRGLSGLLVECGTWNALPQFCKWNRLCKAAGIGEPEIRAIRRSVASVVAASGRLTTAAYVAWLGHSGEIGLEFYQDPNCERPAGSTLEAWLGCEAEFKALLGHCFD